MKQKALTTTLQGIKRFISQNRAIIFCSGMILGSVFAEVILWGPLNVFILTLILAVVATLCAPRMFITSIVTGMVFSSISILSTYAPADKVTDSSVQRLSSKGVDPAITGLPYLGHSKTSASKINSSARGDRVNKPESKEVLITGIVETLPRYRKPGLIEFVIRADNGPRILCRGLDLPWRNSASVRVGDRISLRGRIIKLHPGEELLSYERGLLRDGIEAKCSVEWLAKIEKQTVSWSVFLKEIGSNLRNRIEKFVISENQASEAVGLFFALTLGVRDRVSDETERAFRNLGLSHLLVLSGYQISLVFCIAYWLVLQMATRYCPIFVSGPHLIATVIAFCISALLTVISGIEKPALRALYAVFISQIAGLRGSRPGIANQISTVILCLIVCSGASIIDPSVDLTIAAVIGIAIGNKGSTVSRYLWSNWCATAATGLVSILWFGEWSWIALVVNPLIAPILGIIPICIFFCLMALSLLDPRVSLLFSDAMLTVLSLVRDELITIAQKIPLPNSSNPLNSALICTSILAVAIARWRRLA